MTTREIASLLSFSDDKSARLLTTDSMTDHVTKVTQDATEMMSSTNEKKVPITRYYYQRCSPRYSVSQEISTRLIGFERISRLKWINRLLINSASDNSSQVQTYPLTQITPDRIIKTALVYFSQTSVVRHHRDQLHEYLTVLGFPSIKANKSRYCPARRLVNCSIMTVCDLFLSPEWWKQDDSVFFSCFNPLSSPSVLIFAQLLWGPSTDVTILVTFK